MLKWERIYSISYKGAERRRMWRFKQYMTKNGWITEMVKIAEPKLFASHKTQQKKRTKKKKDTSSRLRRATPTTWSKLLATKHWISVPSFNHIKMRHIVNNTTLDLTLTRKVESGNGIGIPAKTAKREVHSQNRNYQLFLKNSPRLVWCHVSSRPKDSWGASKRF